jgi:hypothetical protein
MTFLESLKPLIQLVPEISSPDRRVSTLYYVIYHTPYLLAQTNILLYYKQTSINIYYTFPPLSIIYYCIFYHQIPFKDRASWTALAILLFLFMSQISLYGVKNTKTADPFYYQRSLLGSSKGTILELGVCPILTSTLVFQVLQKAKLFSVY